MRGVRLLLVLLAVRAVTAAGAEPVAEPELWFPVGEQLVYRIYWGRIPVGISYVTTGWVEQDGRKLLRIRYRTRTNRFLSKLYPVDDTIEALIEPRSFLPVRFTKNLSEGRHRKLEVTAFDHAHTNAVWTSVLKNKTQVFAIEPDTRDLVTFTYFMRKHVSQPGSRAQYRVMADDRIYDVWLQAGAVEPVRLPVYGDVDSVRIDPEAAFEGLFVRTGKLSLWSSQDARRVMTRGVAAVPVGSVRVILVDVNGPGDDFWTQRGPSGEYEEEGVGVTNAPVVPAP